MQKKERKMKYVVAVIVDIVGMGTIRENKTKKYWRTNGNKRAEVVENNLEGDANFNDGVVVDGIKEWRTLGTHCV